MASEHKYFIVKARDGKHSFATVKEAKEYIKVHWSDLSEGHSERYVVNVTRNLSHYASYTKVMDKIVRCD